MEDFVQWIDTKKLYHADLKHSDGNYLTLMTKPTWALTHQLPDGSPAPYSIGTIETPPDGHAARLTTGSHPGIITVSVTAAVSPTAHASTTFKINVKQHPPTPALMEFRISQHRNGAMH